MEYTKYLRYFLIGGLFLTLLIPFLIANGGFLPNMFFPFITGKNFAFRIIVELLFGAWVLLALRDPRYRPRSSAVLWTVLAFTVWAGVATLMSVDPVKSFWSNFERMEGYITVLHLLAYFLIASTVLQAERLWTGFFRGSVLASICMSFYGLLQLAGKITIDQGGVRLDGTLGNAAYLAVYMLFNVFFALLLIERDWKNASLRYFWMGAAALDTFILLFTETRGTILGLIGGLIIAALYLIVYARHDTNLRPLVRLSRWGLGLIAVLVVAFLLVRQVPAVKQAPVIGRLASISLQDKTTLSRFIIWHMAWEGFKERPLFGWGQENFNFVFNKFYDPVMYDQEAWFDRAHDAFLDWLSNAGVLGFLLFIGLFVSAAFVFSKARELSVTEKAVLLGLLAAYAFHEIFVFDNITSYLAFFAVLALAHALSQREVPKAVWMSKPLSNNGMAIAAPVVAVIAIGGAWGLNQGGIANAQNLIHAIEAPSSGSTDYQANLQAFQSIFSGSPLGRQEATEQLLQVAPAVISSSASPEVKQEFYDFAHQEITAMTAQRKGDARLELFFGSFLDTVGNYPEGLTHLELAHEESPDKQQILFEMGMNNMLRSGDLQGALPVLKGAFELDTNYDTARIYYAAALYYNGKNAEADSLIMERFGTLTPDNDTLLQIYFQTKQYARAEAVLNARLANDPQNSQMYVQLAAVYYTQGDTKDAIAVLQKGEAAIPSFGNQAQALISSIETQGKK